jgi:pimeloyl-ACP methyl ester carboxylesterase
MIPDRAVLRRSIRATQEAMMPSAAPNLVELNRVPPHEQRPDVIALHGFLQTLDSWRHLAPKLAARGARFTAFDLKGHGGSPCPPDGKYSLADHAAPILNFVRDNDLRGLTLIGHSFGGAVALRVAVRLVEEGRLRALVLVDSFLDPDAFRIRLLRTLGPLVASRLGWVLRRAPLARLAVRIGLWMLCRHPERIEPEAIEAYAANMRQPDRVRALIETGRQIAAAEYAQLWAELPSIEVPTLIVWGRQDRLLRENAAARLHGRLRGSELFVVDDCGHIPHEERPEIVVEKIAAFVCARAAPQR